MNALYYRHLRLDISSCAIFTVYPNRIMLWYHTRLMVISMQSEGRQSERTLEPSKNVLVKLNLLHMQRGLHSVLSFAHCHAASTGITQYCPRHHSLLFSLLLLLLKKSAIRGLERAFGTLSVWIPQPHNTNLYKEIRERENSRRQKWREQLIRQ